MEQRAPSAIAVIQELFAFMTVLCTDANDIAMQGHAEDDAEQIAALANRIHEAGHRLMTLSDAAIAITQR